MEKKVIFIEGGIGVGKSTLLDWLENVKHRDKFGNIAVVKEPIIHWDNQLENFYKDPAKNWFSLQIFISSTKYLKFREALDDPRFDLIVVERSILTDIAFAKKFETSDPNAYKDYLYIMNMYRDLFFRETVNLNVKFILLKKSVSVCAENLKKRKEKFSISDEYLTETAEAIENFILTLSRTTPNIFEVLILNQEKTVEELLSVIWGIITGFTSTYISKNMMAGKIS